MGRPVEQVKVQRVLALADQDSLLRKRDPRRRWVADVRDEHALPNGGALRAFYIVHVQHFSRKAFVEDARLNFE